MTRLLVLALLLYVLWMALGNFMRKLKAAVSSGALRPEGPAARPAATSALTETLLPCVVCGTYVPASRALTGGEGVFCSEACREQRG